MILAVLLEWLHGSFLQECIDLQYFTLIVFFKNCTVWGRLYLSCLKPFLSTRLHMQRLWPSVQPSVAEAMFRSKYHSCDRDIMRSAGMRGVLAAFGAYMFPFSTEHLRLARFARPSVVFFLPVQLQKRIGTSCMSAYTAS